MSVTPSSSMERRSERSILIQLGADRFARAWPRCRHFAELRVTARRWQSPESVRSMKKIRHALS